MNTNKYKHKKKLKPCAGNHLDMERDMAMKFYSWNKVNTFPPPTKKSVKAKRISYQPH